MDSWQETQLQSLLAAQTEIEFFNALSCAAMSLGFEKCAYGLRAPLPISKPSVILLNNYPANWQEHYVRHNYLEIDPTVTHGMKSVLPIIWSEKLFSACRPFWEEARAHNLRFGWAQSCHDARGIGGLLTLARSHNDFSSSELRANSSRMTWLAQVAYERLSSILIHKLIPETTVTLTAREMEVMRWTGEGKTSGEVGDILNISESTVNFHVNNAIAKLGTTNKTAAAIRAAILKLL